MFYNENVKPAKIERDDCYCITHPAGPFWLPLGRWYMGRPARPVCYRCHPPIGPALLITVSGKSVDTREIFPDDTVPTPVTPPETPAAESPAERDCRSRKGRPSLNISPKLVYDTLKLHRGERKAVAAVAAELGCSRAYIYKIAGVENVRGLTK
jgi:hypothetical protein